MSKYLTDRTDQAYNKSEYVGYNTVMFFLLTNSDIIWLYKL